MPSMILARGSGVGEGSVFVGACQRPAWGLTIGAARTPPCRSSPLPTLEPPPLIAALLERWSRWVFAHPWAVIGVAVLLTTASSLVIAQRFDIRSDIKDLMPEDARSVKDTFTIAGRMGSITSLSIYVEAPTTELAAPMREGELYAACRAEALAPRPDPVAPDATIAPEEDAAAHCDDALVLFARALVGELEQLESVGYVHYRKDKTFFEDNILLYASVESLEQLYDDVDERLRAARKKSGEYKACLLVATSARTAMTSSLAGSGGEATKGEGEESSGDGEFSEDALRERYGASGRTINEYMEYQLPDGAWTLKIQVRFKSGGRRSLGGEMDLVAAPGKRTAELERVNAATVCAGDRRAGCRVKDSQLRGPDGKSRILAG